jgi:hypothetical protein
MKRKIFSFTISILYISSLALLASNARAETIKPEPIALPASEFPLPSTQLEQSISIQDTVALRKHAWALWSGLTADSGQSYQGQVLPIWETWLSEDEAFASFSQLLVLSEQRVLRPFAKPSQLRHRVQGPAITPWFQIAPNIDNSRLLAFVKFNSNSAQFVASSHASQVGAGEVIYYNKTVDLEKLNAYFDQRSTPLADRKIIEFPPAAVDLKVVFFPIKANQLSAIPLWAGPGSSSNPRQPASETWTHCVAVDPTNSKSGVAQINCNNKSIQAEIVPLNHFYSIKLDAVSAKAINSLLGLTGESILAEGDIQVLLAMHVTTKEIASWTWQTFWWQNGQSPPSSVPGGIEDMPDSGKVKGAWRNYAMCVADSIVVPATDRNGQPVVCYNPYLETRQVAGISSNCMSCHARATFPGAPYPESYSPNGWIDPSNAEVFSDQTKTDFVWAIQNSAH